MKKEHQKELVQWLKEQSVISHRLLNISHFFGLINTLLIVLQAWILSNLLHYIISEKIPRKMLLLSFITLVMVFILRSWIIWLREQVGFNIGKHIRCEIRRKVLDRLQKAGPAWIRGKPIGSWSTLILEQIEDIHDYYAHYLPQINLAIYAPLIVIITLFSVNWVAPLILLCTAPLIPFFMTMIGMNATDSNQRNFLALSRLSGYFLDRLRGIETLRLFDRCNEESENIRCISQNFRKRTMEVLRLAFLSSSVLEFFTSISIGLVAVYFGFSYLGKLNFGRYGTVITLSSGFLTLILSPEFFQPLRDLGTFYHAKAQAVAAANNIKEFLETSLVYPKFGNLELDKNSSICVVAKDLIILSPEGKILAGPLNFVISAGQRVALVGISGSGKTSILNVLSGFLPYKGSLRINHIELCMLDPILWRRLLSWVGQNPHLPASTLIDNILLSNPYASEKDLNNVLKYTQVNEFLPFLPNRINSIIGDQGEGLSAGQIQRIAIARAILSPCKLLLLDEPTTSLDIRTEKYVMNTLNDVSRAQTTIMVTHQLNSISKWDRILVMKSGKIVEQGDYATLCTLRGNFFTLLTNSQREI